MRDSSNMTSETEVLGLDGLQEDEVQLFEYLQYYQPEEGMEDQIGPIMEYMLPGCRKWTEAVVRGAIDDFRSKHGEYAPPCVYDENTLKTIFALHEAKLLESLSDKLSKHPSGPASVRRTSLALLTADRLDWLTKHLDSDIAIFWRAEAREHLLNLYNERAELEHGLPDTRKYTNKELVNLMKDKGLGCTKADRVKEITVKSVVQCIMDYAFLVERRVRESRRRDVLLQQPL